MFISLIFEEIINYELGTVGGTKKGKIEFKPQWSLSCIWRDKAIFNILNNDYYLMKFEEWEMVFKASAM